MRAAFTGAARQLREAAAGAPWVAVWAAGQGVIASDPGSLMGEERALRLWAEALAAVLPPRSGVVHLVSSAGGIYAGSVPLPVEVGAPPQPLNAYGELKLRMEGVLTEVLAGDFRVHIARYSTLYGPHQRLDKPQGLIAKLCHSALTGDSTTVYVPMTTRRDYLHVDDAARAGWFGVGQLLDRLATSPVGVHLDLIAAGHSHSVATLVAVVEDQAGRRVRVAVGGNPRPGDCRDHAFTPTVTWGVDLVLPLPLPAGVSVTLRSMSTPADRPERP